MFCYASISSKVCGLALANEGAEWKEKALALVSTLWLFEDEGKAAVSLKSCSSPLVLGC